MVWQPELDELKYRRHLAEQMGGPEGITRQHERGKLAVRERVAALVDSGSFQEIGGLAGSATYEGNKLVAFRPSYTVIGLCTLNGRKVVIAGDKVIRFLQLCATFHLPVVYFADESGFMVGLEAQKQGIVRAGARIVCATYQTRMPWITFVVRQLCGVAGQCHDRPSGVFKRVAWPSANWGLDAY